MPADRPTPPASTGATVSKPETVRCAAKVYVRDTYRVSRRGGRHFRMHYSAKRCARLAMRAGLCAQHAKIADDGRYIDRDTECWP